MPFPPLLFFHIYIIAFLVNVLWEVLHSQLYTTCLDQPWTKNVPLLVIMSLKDAFFITLFYGATVLMFGGYDVFADARQLSAFVLLGLSFAFADETVSIRRKRWEYAPAMPTVLGVGVTPLLEIAATGIITFAIVFYL